MTEKDYPAAHSMDTQWFAIDKNGHVAGFDSGEAGAVPANGIRDFDLDKHLAELHFDEGDWCQSADGKIFRIDWHKNITELQPTQLSDMHAYCLLWLDGEAEWDLFLATSRKVKHYSLRNQHFTLKLVDTIQGALLRSAIAQGLVNRAWIGFHALNWLERFGIFSYEHGNHFENWIAGPYVKGTEPSQPVRVSDLSENLSNQLSGCQLPLSYKSEPSIQPAEQLPCEFWERRWIDRDGKIHQENTEG